MLSAGFDVGGTTARAVVVNDEDRVVVELVRPTGVMTGPEELRALLEDMLVAAEDDAGMVTRVGVGFPGLIDPATGSVVSSAILEGWSAVPLADMLTTVLRRPCVVDNDVNNAARIELAREGVRDALLTTVGTGVGGALVVDGRLRTGAHGVAGEIGHLPYLDVGEQCRCGASSCLNLSTSGTAIERQLGLAPGTLESALDRKDTWEVIEQAARALGTGLAGAANLLDLDLIVVGGGVAELGDRYLGAVRAAFVESAMPEMAACPIEPARHGVWAGALGSASLATSSGLGS